MEDAEGKMAAAVAELVLVVVKSCCGVKVGDTIFLEDDFG